MNLPCKELKRIARDNLNGNYKIPMGAFLAATLIPLAVELPFSMLQKDAQPLPVTIMFYVAEFLITLLSMVLSVGILQRICFRCQILSAYSRMLRSAEKIPAPAML